MKSIFLPIALVLSSLSFAQTVEVDNKIQTLWRTQNMGAALFELDKFQDRYYFSFHNSQYQYISDRGSIPFQSLESCLKYFEAVQEMYNTPLEGQNLVVHGELAGITWEACSYMGSLGRTNVIRQGQKFAFLRPSQLQSLLTYLRENTKQGS